MIITKTPFRMSFFGGGTDMESFFREYGGAVLSTTFDKYCYVNVRHLPPFFSYATELSYAKTERVNSLEEIEHPAIRNAMKMLDMHHIRLTYEADLPARSGLGTSSSFAVGMLNAFYALKGQYASKEKLAKEAIYLERVLCAEAGGWQDQIAAAFGGFNRIDFSADGYEVRPVLLSPERKRRLNGRLMMFFTGFTRFSAEIQQLNNSRNGADKLARLQEMLALVDEAEAILTDEQADLNEFGRLLDHTWKLKRGTGAAVSTDCIDACTPEALPPVRWAENCWARAAVDFWYFTWSRNIRPPCARPCRSCFISRSALKTVARGSSTMRPRRSRHYESCYHGRRPRHPHRRAGRGSPQADAAH